MTDINGLVITVQRDNNKALKKFSRNNPDNVLWGFTKNEHAFLTFSDAECENTDLLSAIVKVLSIAREKAESELELQKQENEWKNNDRGNVRVD